MAQVFARVLESARRHQPLAGTLFPVDNAGASAENVVVRLPPWVGHCQRQQPDGSNADGAARQAQRGSTHVGQSPSDGATRNGSVSRAQARSWAAPASLPRPGFPVQRSPATSPQKPSPASVTTVEAVTQPSATPSVEASADHFSDAASKNPTGASGALGPQQYDRQQQQQQQQHAAALQELAATAQRGGFTQDWASDNGVAPNSARVAALGTARETAPARSDAAPVLTLAAQPVGRLSSLDFVAEEAATSSVGQTSAAVVPMRNTDMDQQHQQSLSGVAMKPKGDSITAHLNLQQAADIHCAEGPPADVWDGHDAALLAVIVEHAKVLRTINAGEAGSSCSLM